MTYSHQQLTEFLKGGRKKYMRPLYDRRLYVRRANKFMSGGDLEIYAEYNPTQPYIIIHPDDTMTIQAQAATTAWGGSWIPLRGYSTRFTLQRYAGIEVIVRNFQPYIIERDAGRTPSKIQGCRTCRQTGKVDLHCYPETCWNYDSGSKSCRIHGEIPEESIRAAWRNYHQIACQHNEYYSHRVPKGQVCPKCNGTKKAEYGLNQIKIPWDGSPLKVKDGNILKQPLTELERMVASHVGPTT